MSVLQRSALDADGARVDVFTSDDYAEGGGATLQDIVDEAVDIEGAIGDETTASQSADSSVSATLIERVTALVDALTSGQADDELRVALASDLLTGNLDINVNDQTGDVDVNLATDSLAGNLDVDLAEVSSAPIDVSAAEVDVDLNSQSLARLTHKIELTNGTSYDEIQRVGSDLGAAVQQWNAGTLNVQEDTALDVSGATVPTEGDTAHDSVDAGSPLKIGAVYAPSQGDVDQGDRTDLRATEKGDLSIAPLYHADDSVEARLATVEDTTTSTGPSSAAQVNAAGGRTQVSVAWDTSGSATISVQVSDDAQVWFDRTDVISSQPSSAETVAETFQSGFRYVRVYADQNLTSLRISAKGL